jgi:hypothetical protein
VPPTLKLPTAIMGIENEYDFKNPTSKRKFRTVVITPYTTAKGKSNIRSNFILRNYNKLSI